MPAQRHPRSSAPHQPAPRPPSTPSPSPDADADDRPAAAREPDESVAASFRRDFNEAVYACVRRIPEGKVASYGHIAHLIGHPRHSRMVGAALKALPRAQALPFVADAPDPARGRSAASERERGRRRRRGEVRSDDDDDDASAGRARPSPSSSSSSSSSPAPLPPPLPNPAFVPWHRVVSSSGLISPRGNPAATRRQGEWLEAEGVVVRRAGAGAGAGAGGAGGGGGGGGEDGGGREHGDAFGLAERVDGGGRVSMAQFAWKG